SCEASDASLSNSSASLSVMLVSRSNSSASKVLTGATSRDGLATTLALNAEEFERLTNITDKLAEELLSDASEASQEQYRSLQEDAQARFEAAKAKDKARDETSQGAARLALMIAMFTALAVVERDMQSVCTCERGLIDCPTQADGDRGLIPLASVTMTKADSGFGVRDLSNYTYRKQSHNWRSDRYYFGDRIAPMMGTLGDRCGGTEGIDTIAEALLSWNPTEEDFEAAPESPYWPPDPGISNLAEINGIDLRGFDSGKAVEVLANAKIELFPDAVFNIEEGEIFERIAKVLNKASTQPLNLNYEARTGDAVGMVTDREDRVVDVFVVRAGRFAGFSKSKEAAESGPSRKSFTDPDIEARLRALELARSEKPSGETADLEPLQRRIADLESENADLRTQLLQSTPIVMGLSQDVMPAFEKQPGFVAMGQLQAMKTTAMNKAFGEFADQIRTETQAFFKAKK
ncbi:MAG: hypothetical protein AAGH17_05215, partial [Pseudomonadota bacterium]